MTFWSLLLPVILLFLGGGIVKFQRFGPDPLSFCVRERPHGGVARAYGVYPGSRRAILPAVRREGAMPYGDDSGEPVMLAHGEDYPELRESIRKICEG